MALAETLTRSQFVAIHLPLTDLRQLLSADSGRLGRPAWPDPEEGREFVRGVGVVQRLVDSSIPWDWRSPRSYVDASALIRLTAAWSVTDPVWIKPIYRRLWGDGLGWRVAVGMVVHWHPDVVDRTATVLARHVLGLPVRVAGRERPLLESDRALAAAVLRQTTRAGVRQEPWWMASGRTLIQMEEPADVPTGVALSSVPVVCRKRPISVFLLRRTHHSTGEARRLRAALWHTFHDLESVRMVLRAWRVHGPELDPDAVRDFLAPRLKRLTRRASRGYGGSGKPPGRRIQP